VADCGDVLATTVRRRDLMLPTLDPAAAAARIHAAPVATAILFGPERSAWKPTMSPSPATF
jgi:tRNA/rRNA methyltransferase